METLAIIALILITMAAYSAGVAAGMGKGREPKPGLADLLIMLALWAAALASRSVFPPRQMAGHSDLARSRAGRRVAGRPGAKIRG